MKKVITALTLVGTTLIFASCSKTSNWKCVCDLGSTTVERVYTDAKKKDAKQSCDEINKNEFPNDKCSLSEE